MKPQPTTQNLTLTNIQIRDAVSGILAGQTNSGALAPLIEQQNLWQQPDFVKLLRWKRAKRISDTATFFYEYFRSPPRNLDVPALRADSPFARNMIEHSNSGNLAACQKDMQLYCDYIALLSTKPREIQEAYFDSFPPKTTSDIACPGGTGSRLEELIDNLKVPKEDRPILEIHQLLMSKLIDRLKYNVPDGHQVHLLPYLNFAFGVESKEEVEKRDVTFTTPQFSIPAYVLQEELTSYAENFRAEVQKRMNRLRGEINAICTNFDADIVYDPTQTEKLDELTEKFRALGITLSEFGALIKEKENSQNNEYVWDYSAVDSLVKRDLLSRLASHHPDKTYVVSQVTTGYIPRGSDLFKEDAKSKIAALLRSDNTEDLLTGVESLWTLGIRLAGNSPIQLIETISLLPANFLQDTVTPRLPASQHFKIQNILENYDSYNVDPRINAYFSSTTPSLKDLLYGNAAYEKLEQYFKDKSEGSYEKKNREIEKLTESEFRQLMSRPDKKEIFLKITENNIILPENVVAKLLEVAAENNEIDFCRDQLLQFTEEANPRLFSSSKALISAIKISNTEMTALFLKKGAATYLETPDEKGLFPIHHAAIAGGPEIITLLKEAGADLNKYIRLKVDTPAHLAASFGKISNLHSLKNNGADLDKPLEDKLEQEYRPIHNAIIKRQNDAVIALIDLGVRITRHELDIFSSSFLAREPHLLTLIATHDLPEAFEKCFTKLKELETAHHNFCHGNQSRNNFENIQQLLNRSASIAISKDQPEMLKSTLKCGAKIPTFYISSSEEVRKIIDDYQPFTAVSRAITTAITKNLTRLTSMGVKELLTLEGEIRASLIEAYSSNAEEMLRDFKIDESDRVKSCSPFSQKYKITPTFMKLGQTIAPLLTCRPNSYSIYLPLTYNDISISETNRDTIFSIFKNKDKIKELTTPSTAIQQNQEHEAAQPLAAKDSTQDTVI